MVSNSTVTASISDDEHNIHHHHQLAGQPHGSSKHPPIMKAKQVSVPKSILGGAKVFEEDKVFSLDGGGSKGILK